jgi:hypothetical protein
MFKIFAVGLLAAGPVACAGAQAAGATTTTLVPDSLTTTAGATGGQPVSVLDVRDQSGTPNDWNRYVEFWGQPAGTAYAGYTGFTLPGSVAPSSITGLQVQVNYQGPAAGTQIWMWSLYNWASSSWVSIGTNAAAPDWGVWTLLSFAAGGTLADYVSSTGALRLQLTSNNASDNADIDYEAIVVTSTASGGPDDFSVSASPASGSVVQGSSAATTVSTAVTSGSPQPVALSASGAPSGVSVSFAPSSVTAGSSSTATIATTSSAAAGTYPITITGTAASGSHTASYSLTVSPGSGGITQVPPPLPCPACWVPPLRTSWNWVLSAVPSAPYRNVSMYDIDGFDATASDVWSMHAAGIKVVCYISAGTYENWRPDASQFPSQILGNGNGWPGEKWLDIRDVQKPGSVLLSIMTARLDMCKSKGFDGVELDNVDGYTNSTGFPLTANDQAIYNAVLANAAHQRGMFVLLKNDLGQVSTLLPYFDAALNEQCNQYSECGNLSQFVQAGKAVFNAEYSGSTSSFCPADNAANFNGVLYSINLDDSVFQPCR